MTWSIFSSLSSKKASPPKNRRSGADGASTALLCGGHSASALAKLQPAEPSNRLPAPQSDLNTSVSTQTTGSCVSAGPQRLRKAVSSGAYADTRGLSTSLARHSSLTKGATFTHITAQPQCAAIIFAHTLTDTSVSVLHDCSNPAQRQSPAHNRRPSSPSGCSQHASGLCCGSRSLICTVAP